MHTSTPLSNSKELLNYIHCYNNERLQAKHNDLSLLELRTKAAWLIFIFYNVYLTGGSSTDGAAPPFQKVFLNIIARAKNPAM